MNLGWTRSLSRTPKACDNSGQRLVLGARSSVDRASVFGTEGRGFESLRAYHLLGIKEAAGQVLGASFFSGMVTE